MKGKETEKKISIKDEINKKIKELKKEYKNYINPPAAYDYAGCSGIPVHHNSSYSYTSFWSDFESRDRIVKQIKELEGKLCQLEDASEKYGNVPTKSPY